MRLQIGTEICTAHMLLPETVTPDFKHKVHIHWPIRTHHERSELPDGHDGLVDVYIFRLVTPSIWATELEGGAKLEGGDGGAGAPDTVGAVDQGRAVAGKEAK